MVYLARNQPVYGGAVRRKSFSRRSPYSSTIERGCFLPRRGYIPVEAEKGGMGKRRWKTGACKIDVWDTMIDRGLRNKLHQALHAPESEDVLKNTCFRGGSPGCAMLMKLLLPLDFYSTEREIQRDSTGIYHEKPCSRPNSNVSSDMSLLAQSNVSASNE